MFNENHCKSLGEPIFSLKRNCLWRWPTCIEGNSIGPLALYWPLSHWHRAIAIGPLPLAHQQTILMSYSVTISSLLNQLINQLSTQLIRLNEIRGINQVIKLPQQWHWAMGIGALECEFWNQLWVSPLDHWRWATDNNSKTH